MVYDLFLGPGVENLPATMEERNKTKRELSNVIIKKLTFLHSSKTVIRNIESSRKKGSQLVRFKLRCLLYPYYELYFNYRR